MGGGGSKNKKSNNGNNSKRQSTQTKAVDPAFGSNSKSTTTSKSPTSFQVTSSSSGSGVTKDPSSKSSSGKPKKESGTPKKQESESAFSQKRLDELFAKYKEKDDDVIGPDGMSRFCADLGVDPEDVVLLVLAYHLNAQTMGYFTREEFTKGLQRMGVDSIAKMKSKLPDLGKDLEDPNKFKEIYRFSFNFAKEPDQKILDLQMADGMLRLVMGDKPHTNHFLTFLKETSYKALNMDQWMNFLEFSRTVREDFSNYDENSAWPVILDEYAEWHRKQQSAASSAPHS